MVYVGIPKNYTTSPSSFAGTPSLTINYEATQDLDSTNAFEGMIFSQSWWKILLTDLNQAPRSSSKCGLLRLPRSWVPQALRA